MEILSFIAFAFYPVALCVLLFYAFHFSSKIDVIETNVSQIWSMCNDIHSLHKDVKELSNRLDLLNSAEAESQTEMEANYEI